jgi:hypothetical protein
MPIDWLAVAVACSLLFAGIGKLLFAHSQRGRQQAFVLAWLALPYLLISIIYFNAALTWPSIEIMRLYARLGFITIGLSTGLILTILSIALRGKHGA